MVEISEDKLCEIIFYILHLERKNLRSRAKSDQRMSEEIQKLISEYAKLKY